jgi:hypothetical protein
VPWRGLGRLRFLSNEEVSVSILLRALWGPCCGLTGALRGPAGYWALLNFTPAPAVSNKTSRIGRPKCLHSSFDQSGQGRVAEAVGPADSSRTGIGGGVSEATQEHQRHVDASGGIISTRLLSQIKVENRLEINSVLIESSSVSNDVREPPKTRAHSKIGTHFSSVGSSENYLISGPWGVCRG